MRKSHFPASELDCPVRGVLMGAHTPSFGAGILSLRACASSTSSRSARFTLHRSGGAGRFKLYAAQRHCLPNLATYPAPALCFPHVLSTTECESPGVHSAQPG